VHTLGLRRPSNIPFPQYIEITCASILDLTASRNILEKIEADVSILDKAYADTELAKQIQKMGNILLTSIKDKKGWEAVLKQKDQSFTYIFNTAQYCC